MQPNHTRRHLLLALPAAGLLTACAVSAGRPGERDIQTRLKELERSAGGRLGVCILDSRNASVVGHRIDERFGLTSTFKLALAALVLRESDSGRINLDEFITYTSDDLETYAPVTTRRLKQGGMTIAALAKAAQTTSDNTATNLLLTRLGGPAWFTKSLRAIGDSTTRLDRNEPTLNLVPPNEVRDTTTPLAMTQLVAEIFTGRVLQATSRERLKNWLVDTQTGPRRLRAGLPSTWTIGNKTGTGISDSMPNKTNDIAVVWRDDGSIAVITAYYDAAAAYPDFRPQDEDVLAEVGRVATDWIAG